MPDDPLFFVLSKLGSTKKQGGYWMARCPAHDDTHRSLSIQAGTTQPVVLNCHAGCAQDLILAALGITWDQICTPKDEPPPGFHIVATYAYTDENGVPLFYAERRMPKAFRQYHLEHDQKIWTLNGVRRVLYHLPVVIEAVKQGETVYICEGEKDVHAIEAAGAAATCNPMGAGKWRPEYSETLTGANIVIIADRDEPGRKHAREVAASLHGKAASIRVVEPLAGKDAHDHLSAGHTLAEFREPAAEKDGDGDDAAYAELAARYAPVNWADAWGSQPQETDWLYEPLLERGTVNALFAKPGTGKSLLALEISVQLARNGTVVMYIDDENRVTDVVERLQALGCPQDQPPPHLDNLLFYNFAGLPALDTPLGGTHLLALARTNAAELVILDTTTRMVAGRENDSDTFLQLYRCSLVPLKSLGMTVLRLDHPGKDMTRGQRGSSAKDGDVDTIWRLEEEDPLSFRLSRDKSRSGHGDAAEIRLRRHSEPLRHRWETGGVPGLSVPVLDVLNVLQSLNAPVPLGRDRCRRLLHGHGIETKANDVMRRALNYWNEHKGNLPDLSRTGPGQADNSLRPPVLSPHPLGGGQVDRPAQDSWPHGSIGENP